jgi:tripartite ATP-independent transporter DctP family solute receptor
LILAGAGLLAGPAEAPPGAPPAPVVKLRVAHVYNEKYAWHRSFERFRDVLKQRSGGTIDVEIYANMRLGNEHEYVSHLRDGSLDGATVSPAAVATVAPEMALFDLMYLWKDREHWRRALDGDVGRRMADSIRASSAKGNVPGFELLGYWGGNEMHLASRTRGYTTLADLEGLKIRIQDSPVQIELWRLLGTRPVSVPYENLRAALKEGTVEAAVSVASSSTNMKFYEVAPHWSQTGHAISVRPFLFCGQTWKKLTTEQRGFVVEAAKEATTVDRALEAQDERDAEAELKKQGVRFYTFTERDKMREQTAAVRERVAHELKLDDMLADIESAWEKPGAKKK